jgi:hypothetical protein
LSVIRRRWFNEIVETLRFFGEILVPNMAECNGFAGDGMGDKNSTHSMSRTDSRCGFGGVVI